MTEDFKHHLSLVAVQLLIALLVACFVMWMVPATDRIAGGVIGFGASLLVTAWPAKVIHRARKQRK